MQWMFDSYIAIRDFMELGGPVLNVIAFVILWMWVLIIERVVFFRREFPRQVRAQLADWENRGEHHSWHARMVRRAMLSRLKEAAGGSVSMIKTLVALCPLLGLVGTVTGMIDVFDVLSIAGTGNARSMAAGVSKATIPTMAGMVGALFGVLAVTWITRTSTKAVKKLDDIFVTD
ncbi:biopolymer transporter ExbB [bacterium DOLZORAL124_64_63]|nr:MAG: biopolymer transporter ExbB [bacterium DOLZORAL124_64_63]